LLPVAQALVEKYKDHRQVKIKGRLFPVPTNKHYNEALKGIGHIKQFTVILRPHRARYYFANEVLYNNGMQLKTVARIMGQDSAGQLSGTSVATRRSSARPRKR